MSNDHKVCTRCGYVGRPAFSLFHSKCPMCNHSSMVALRSEAGHAVLSQGINQPRMWVDTSNEFEHRT